MRKEGRKTLTMEALYSQNVPRHSSQDSGADLSGTLPLSATLLYLVAVRASVRHSCMLFLGLFLRLHRKSRIT